MTAPLIVSIGELLVEFVSHEPGCGLKKLAEFSGPYPSGAPAICIDQAARMGAKTKIIGGLGEDSFGDALIERLRSHGADTSGIIRLKEKTTGVAFVSYFEDGTRTFVFHLDNTAADAIVGVDVNLPDIPVILHISGASLGNRVFRKLILDTIPLVISNGGKISCDPNARIELLNDPEARNALMQIMQQATYLFPSTSDLDFLFPGQSRSMALQTLQSCGSDVLALKRGHEGVLVYANNRALDLAGYKVSEIDPTGAGDCFCGTFLAAIATGKSAEVAGTLANAAAALSVTKRGPMEGNSSPEDIENFIRMQSVISMENVG